MALATGSQVKFSYITEATAGTFPATPALNVFAVQDFTIEEAKDTFTDSAIYADRQTHFFRHGNVKLNGDITVTLLGPGASPTGNTFFDPWFESLFRSAWTSNVLKVGNTPESFSFEKAVTDVSGTTNYFRTSGVQCSAVTIDLALNAPVKAKFTWTGMSQAATVTTPITGATYVAQPSTSLPFIHTNASNVFKEGGSATTLLTSLSVTINTALTANYGAGNATAIAVTAGKTTVTGTATYFFSDSSLYNKFINETGSSLEFKISDGTHAMDFLLPNVVYSAATQTVNNENTLLVTMPFTAIYDSGTSTTVQITRS